MNVLGLSAFYHDSAAALVRNGEVVAAAQEERFTRKKGDENFPKHSIEFCLRQSGLALSDIDLVAFYDKPLLTFDRLLETYLAFAPHGFTSFAKAIPIWVKQKILQKSLIYKSLNEFSDGAIRDDQIVFSFHHHSHAASAFYPAPFESSALLVIDGVGEWATTSLGRASGENIDLFSEIRFPHSLGMLYSAFTYFLGFAVNDGEYKVMGLAPYGSPIYVQKILDNFIDIKSDGSFRLNLDYFDYCTGLRMTNDRFGELFGGLSRRAPSEPMTKIHADIASSLQVVLEESVLKLCQSLHAQTGERNLCMAGGVSLNCVANGRILREGPFEDIWVQPASGDAGGALGAAYAAAFAAGEKRPTRRGADGMRGSYLGPSFSEDEIAKELETTGAVYHALPKDELIERTADLLASGKIVGWFQGQMEFGPRALGNRSILADARSAAMQRTLNMKIKYRESFRPFAPAVLAEDVSKYFDLDRPSPYMLIVSHVKEGLRKDSARVDDGTFGIHRINYVRSEIPAVTHIDYSARVQTVHQDTNPMFHDLLSAFRDKTNCSVLVNTSFNIRDEPIVCTPLQAYQCFMGSEIDALVVGNHLLLKAEQI